MQEYVWMVPPGGGKPEKIRADVDELTRRMVAGWKQVDPPAEMEE